MIKIEEIHVPEYEKVLEISSPSIDLKAFIALHNCSLGPALGGVRIYPYLSEEEALTDVLRLSKAMTYKSALCETGLGGGKAVIIANPKKDNIEPLLKAFALGINSLNGQYIAAEDVGTSVEEMVILKKYTPYVAALPSRSSSGDPSRFTARGVYLGMKAVAATLWNTNSLKGKTVAIQGLGHVGSKLANLLFWEEANLIFSDTDKEKVEDQAALYGAHVVDKEEIYSVKCDLFSPCALGGILNAKTIAQLKCKGIAGSANNQLLTDEDGKTLKQRGILYAPDYVINSGGVINAAAEFDPEGYDPRTSRRRVRKIEQALLEIFERSAKLNLSTNVIADQLAEDKLAKGIGRRQQPILFTK